jgi:hypothetical protein
MEWFLIVILAGAAIGIEQARSESVVVAEPPTEAEDPPESRAPSPVPVWPACDGPVVYRNLTTEPDAASYWLPDGRRCVPQTHPGDTP